MRRVYTDRSVADDRRHNVQTSPSDGGVPVQGRVVQGAKPKKVAAGAPCREIRRRELRGAHLTEEPKKRVQLVLKRNQIAVAHFKPGQVRNIPDLF